MSKFEVKNIFAVLIMKKILVPTDFSADADSALLFAIEVAKRSKATLTLLNAWHVLTGPFPNGAGVNTVPENDEIRRTSEAKLQSLKKKIVKKTGFTDIDTVAFHGIASDAISYYQDQHPHDLVVMGNRGLSNKKTLELFGSTTNSMISAAEFPVLAVPAKYRFKSFDHFVYAADLHGSELKTTKELLELAKVFSADLTLAHVLDKDKKSAEMTLLRKIRHDITSKRLKIKAIDESSIARGIDNYLRENDCDLLIFATYRRNFFENLFHTSVSRRFTFKTKIPLLLYPKR
jgi:nucleotide-binding universal stress UspA family protein